jgi:hypothetical protein
MGEGPGAGQEGNGIAKIVWQQRHPDDEVGYLQAILALSNNTQRFWEHWEGRHGLYSFSESYDIEPGSLICWSQQQSEATCFLEQVYGIYAIEFPIVHAMLRNSCKKSSTIAARSFCFKSLNAFFITEIARGNAISL